MDISTQKIKLPSKGLLYPKNSPLSTGLVLLKYPTACLEDILINPLYLSNLTWMDLFIKALIIDKSIDYDKILACDKEALLIYSRAMAYGPLYRTKTICKNCLKQSEKEVLLTLIKLKTIKEDMLNLEGNIVFTFEEDIILYKVPDSETLNLIKQLKKGFLKLDRSMRLPDNIILLKFSIVSINGNKDSSYILNYIKTMSMIRYRKFKKLISSILPGMDMTILHTCPHCNNIITIPIVINALFFWPEL